MATGYEVKLYADVTRIANALERIADAMEKRESARALLIESVRTAQADEPDK
jgi:hypothetical protein